MSRYLQLLDIVAEAKPASIVETGTWTGERATSMASVALKHRPEVRYVGFDLFEDATPADDARELNVKRHASLAEVRQRLIAFEGSHPGFRFTLIKGDTRETLPDAADKRWLPEPLDFVFLDGGHSIRTIASDWTSLMGARVIVLDDYYLPDGMGKRPDITRYGCNRLVDGLDQREWSVVVHTSTDPVSGGGVVALAEVRRRGAQP